MNIHPQVLRKNGRDEFVILPYEEFEAIQQRLEDADDVLELRRAKQEQSASPTISMEQLKRDLDEWI